MRSEHDIRGRVLSWGGWLRLGLVLLLPWSLVVEAAVSARGERGVTLSTPISETFMASAPYRALGVRLDEGCPTFREGEDSRTRYELGWRRVAVVVDSELMSEEIKGVVGIDGRCVRGAWADLRREMVFRSCVRPPSWVEGRRRRRAR